MMLCPRQGGGNAESFASRGLGGTARAIAEGGARQAVRTRLPATAKCATISRAFRLGDSVSFTLRNPYRSMLATFVALAAAGGCGPITMTIGRNAAAQPLRATVVDGPGQGRHPRVAMIDISGMLYTHPRRGILSINESPAGLLHERLALAAADPRVRAVLLRLNTPGGTVTASDVLYRDLQRFKEKTGKPVVALMMDVAASGGYYVACAGDHIVAHPTSVTGSIGVILQTLTMKRAFDRWGVDAVAFTSGPNKEAGSPLSELTDDHRRVLGKMVDDFYARFVNLVRRERPGIPNARFAEVTDGRILSGVEALDAGLVDSTGDLYDAFAKARELAGVDLADLVVYQRADMPVRSPYAVGPLGRGATTQINLAQINLDRRIGPVSAGFFYLWDLEQTVGSN